GAAVADPDAPDAGQDDGAAVVQPYVSTVGATVRVVFPFVEETPAAVFRRGDVVWMLFDTRARLVRPEEASNQILDGLARDFTVESTGAAYVVRMALDENRDRKSTRLNSSHVKISYAVFCLKKKTVIDTY